MLVQELPRVECCVFYNNTFIALTTVIITWEIIGKGSTPFVIQVCNAYMSEGPRVDEAPRLSPVAGVVHQFRAWCGRCP